MPTTYRLFAIGALALAGFPLTSGFFSKDAILLSTFDSNLLLYVVGLFTALLTAFYSFRAVFMAFWGKQRNAHIFEHAHESHGVMTAPLWILAGLALIGGLLNLPFILTMEHWLEDAVGAITFHPPVGLEIGLLLVSALVSLAGIALAYGRYVQNASWANSITGILKPLESLAQHKWYIDELYILLIVDPLRALADFFAGMIDQRAIDGSVNLLGTAHLAAGNVLRRVHNGLVPTYALSLFVGVVVVVVYFVFV